MSDKLNNLFDSDQTDKVKKAARKYVEKKQKDKIISEGFKKNSIETPKVQYKDAAEPDTKTEIAKSKFKVFLSYFKIHKSPGQKAPFKLNPKYVFIILGVICAILIVLSSISESIAKPFKAAASILVVPAQSGINNVGSWMAGQIDKMNTINNLSKENQTLLQEINKIKAENITLRQQDAELKRLKSLLELKESLTEYDTVAAQVVAKDSSKWFASFTINKGTNDGIKKDMNVISQGGLAGIVIDVGPNYSVVRSIIDDDSNISAMFENTEGLCIVSGNLELYDSNLMNFTDVAVTVPITENIPVITSNVSSKYLPGLLIGYVHDFATDGNELTQSGHISPVVDFSDLREVLVITQLKETSD